MDEIKSLEQKAREIRREIIKMLCEAGSGHPGGSLSCVDIVTCLYFSIMRHDPEWPKWPDRDRFVLSKGHGAPAVYAALALSGYFPRDELKRLRKFNNILQGHPDMLRTPGIDFSTGSLGQGLSGACGMAISGKLDNKDYRVYVILGDGEIQEGQIWEAAMFSAHYKLDNICVFLDNNKFQIDGLVNDVMRIEPIEKKWKAFGWHTIRIDGHNISEIIRASKEASGVKEKPTIVLADTIKGKGVSFMENNNSFHGVAPTKEEAERALKELD
jgi:transketolase